MVCAAKGNKLCVCVCVLLGVCSSNKGKRCVLHCLIRHQAWLCSALSSCLISVHVSVRSAVELDGSQPLDHLEKSRFWGGRCRAFYFLRVFENEFIGV